MQILGRHVIIEIDNAQNLTDVSYIEESLKTAAIATGATILMSNFHKFGGEGGVSGVIVLAESHISIHTWPEYGYAALDIFVCGDCDPMKAIPIIRERFKTNLIRHKLLERGMLDQITKAA